MVHHEKKLRSRVCLTCTSYDKYVKPLIYTRLQSQQGNKWTFFGTCLEVVKS